jgi:hypothetical protein
MNKIKILVLNFCIIVFGIGVIVIPFFMQFNPEVKVLLNLFTMCVLGLFTILGFYKIEIDFEEIVKEVK